MVFFNVLNCIFFLLGDFSRITIIGWHVDTFLHCRVFFFFNLFSFAEIQIDLSNLKIQSQYCPICFSSDIKYIHNVPKHYHYPSSWFIPCSTGKPYDLNCIQFPSPITTAVSHTPAFVMLITSEYLLWAFMMSHKTPHRVYVQAFKETRSQLIGDHFIRLRVRHWQGTVWRKTGSTVDVAIVCARV